MDDANDPRHRPADVPRRRFIYPGRKARQGEIILRTRTQRLIFFAGLVGLVILAVILRVAFRP